MSLFDWRKYLQDNPNKYNWYERGFNGCGDDQVAMAIPESLWVGSCISDIPDCVNHIVSAAKETAPAYKCGVYNYDQFDLPDPGYNTNFMDIFSCVIIKLLTLLRDKANYIYLHCNCGYSRSISVASTVAAAFNKTSVIHELLKIQKQRSEVWPEPCYIIAGEFLNGEMK